MIEVKNYMALLLKSLSTDYEIEDLQIGKTKDGFKITFREDEDNPPKDVEVRYANHYRKVTIEVKFDKELEVKKWEVSDYSPGYCACPNCKKPEA